MTIETPIQKIEENVKQVDGSYIIKHRQTSADIVLYDTGKKDENGNTIYSDTQTEINDIKAKNAENDEVLKDMSVKQKSMSELFHSITKVSNNLVKTSTSEIPTSYGVAKYFEENINLINSEKAESYTLGTLATFPHPGSPKILYIDTDTDTIYYWDSTDYVSVGGRKEKISFLPYNDFPLSGEKEMLYIDTSVTNELKIYRWNGEGYVSIKSSDYGGDLSVVSDEYDPAKDYAVGEYCIYENVLYRFTSEKTAGEWDETAVQATTVSTELQEVSAKIQGTILWENPNPSVAFAEQIITLSSADYDYLEFYYKDSSGKGNVSYQKITKVLLRTVSGVSLTIATWTRNPDKSLLLARGINYISDTELKVLNAFTESGINNVFAIPILIIGY